MKRSKRRKEWPKRLMESPTTEERAEVTESIARATDGTIEVTERIARATEEPTK